MERANDPTDDAPFEVDPQRAAEAVLGGPDLGASLQRWAAEARVDEAARARNRQRWLQVQAEEGSSLVGVLLDLAEQERAVVLDVGAERLPVRLVGLGSDFVATQPRGRGGCLFVRTEVIEAVHSAPGGDPVTGDRAPVLDVDLASVLVPAAADRPDVVVVTRSGRRVRGELRSASAELLRVRVPGDPPAVTWLPFHGVSHLELGP